MDAARFARSGVPGPPRKIAVRDRGACATLLSLSTCGRTTALTRPLARRALPADCAAPERRDMAAAAADTNDPNEDRAGAHFENNLPVPRASGAESVNPKPRQGYGARRSRL
jgi:hypothetical protein